MLVQQCLSNIKTMQISLLIECTWRFSLSLNLLITDKFRYASLDFLKSGPRKGSKFWKSHKQVIIIFKEINTLCDSSLTDTGDYQPRYAWKICKYVKGLKVKNIYRYPSGGILRFCSNNQISHSILLFTLYIIYAQGHSQQGTL